MATGVDFNNAIPVLSGGSVEATLSPTLGKIYFSLDVVQGTMYTVDVLSSSDTYGHLYNSSQVEIDKDDDDGEGYNPLIKFVAAETGTIFFMVRPYGSISSSIPITVRLVEHEPLDGDSFDNPIEVPLDGSAQATLMSSFKNIYFSLNVTQGITYIVDVLSSKDTYGHLYDSSRVEIDKDDDDGEGSNPLIEFVAAETGIIFFMVRPYSSSISADIPFTVRFVEKVIEPEPEPEPEPDPGTITPLPGTGKSNDPYVLTLGHIYTQALVVEDYSFYLFPTTPGTSYTVDIIPLESSYFSVNAVDSPDTLWSSYDPVTYNGGSPDTKTFTYTASNNYGAVRIYGGGAANFRIAAYVTGTTPTDPPPTGGVNTVPGAGTRTDPFIIESGFIYRRNFSNIDDIYNMDIYNFQTVPGESYTVDLTTDENLWGFLSVKQADGSIVNQDSFVKTRTVTFTTTGNNVTLQIACEAADIGKMFSLAAYVTGTTPIPVEGETEEKHLESISISGAPMMAVGESQFLSVTYIPNDTTDDKTVTFTATPADLVFFNTSNQITASRTGEVTIRATSAANPDIFADFVIKITKVQSKKRVSIVGDAAGNHTISTGNDGILVNGVPIAVHGSLVTDSDGVSQGTVISDRYVFSNDVSIAASDDATSNGDIIPTVEDRGVIITDFREWIPIRTAVELMGIGTVSGYPSNGFYYLANDIDFALHDGELLPESIDIIFTGTLDGRGNRIKNLNHNRLAESASRDTYTLLFKEIRSASIYDITFVDPFTDFDSRNNHVLLLAYNVKSSEVENITVKGKCETSSALFYTVEHSDITTVFMNPYLSGFGFCDTIRNSNIKKVALVGGLESSGSPSNIANFAYDSVIDRCAVISLKSMNTYTCIVEESRLNRISNCMVYASNPRYISITAFIVGSGQVGDSIENCLVLAQASYKRGQYIGGVGVDNCYLIHQEGFAAEVGQEITLVENQYQRYYIVNSNEAYTRQSTYNGLDFTNTWKIKEGRTVPYLKWLGKHGIKISNYELLNMSDIKVPANDGTWTHHFMIPYPLSRFKIEALYQDKPGWMEVQFDEVVPHHSPDFKLERVLKNGVDVTEDVSVYIDSTSELNATVGYDYSNVSIDFYISMWTSPRYDPFNDYVVQSIKMTIWYFRRISYEILD